MKVFSQDILSSYHFYVLCKNGSMMEDVYFYRIVKRNDKWYLLRETYMSKDLFPLKIIEVPGVEKNDLFVQSMEYYNQKK